MAGIPMISLFIGGIHGVGKSHFSSQLGSILKMPYFSAGDLISKWKKDSAHPDKRVKDIVDNQDSLIAAIQELGLSSFSFILDGHFCVLDAAGNIQKIPMETFKALAPECVILLVDDVLAIQKRLYQRDGKEHPSDKLESMQRAETKYAGQVCEHLKIPIEILHSPDVPRAKQFFLKITADRGQR